VVGYEQQRLLLGSTPAGISFISHLPPCELQEAEAPAPVSFTDVLRQVLVKK
jgi:hypothetical protein